jgi:hypothetical protein
VKCIRLKATEQSDRVNVRVSKVSFSREHGHRRACLRQAEFELAAPYLG